MNYKLIIGLITVALAFIGYYPYIVDILKGKTKPHAYTWLVWTLADVITAGLQIKGGAGFGAWPTVAIAFICLIIFILSFFKGSKDIVIWDTIFLLLALLSLFLWLVIKQPVLSIILIVATDILGFIPTIRKSWHDPYSETLFTYELTGVRHALSILALGKFNILTALYPAVWALANIFFSAILILRRRTVKISF